MCIRDRADCAEGSRGDWGHVRLRTRSPWTRNSERYGEKHWNRISLINSSIAIVVHVTTLVVAKAFLTGIRKRSLAIVEAFELNGLLIICSGAHFCKKKSETYFAHFLKLEPKFRCQLFRWCDICMAVKPGVCTDRASGSTWVSHPRLSSVRLKHWIISPIPDSTFK